MVEEDDAVTAKMIWELRCRTKIWRGCESWELPETIVDEMRLFKVDPRDQVRDLVMEAGVDSDDKGRMRAKRLGLPHSVLPLTNA